MLPNVIMRLNQSALCSLVSRQVISLSSINWAVVLERIEEMTR